MSERGEDLLSREGMMFLVGVVYYWGVLILLLYSESISAAFLRSGSFTQESLSAA